MNADEKLERELQAWHEEAAKLCSCLPPYPCPCDGVLAGGMCDGMGHEPDFSRGDEEELDDD